MPLETAVTKLLGIDHPIIQAPMAGGGDTPALVSAVSEAGGFGSIGGAYLTPDGITEAARKVQSLSNRPFGINLFAPVAVPDRPWNPEPAIDKIAPFFKTLGLPRPEAPTSGGLSFEDQVTAALRSGARVFSFTFGIMPPAIIRAARAQDMIVIGTATTVEEAVTLQEAGVDAIVAQGAEAGGHRGTFTGSFDDGMIGVMALVPQVVDAVEIPVIASGGIMDGRGLAAALALGAAAVQLGTAFLTTAEAGVPQVYKDAIQRSGPQDTRITRAFSGRPARGIRNEILRAYEGAHDDEILPFPHQNALTRPLRNAAGQADKVDYLSLWAGQGLGLAKPVAARKLVHQIAADARTVIARMHQ